MKCPECKTEMELKFVHDTCTSEITVKGVEMSIAYNVYQCWDCMIIARKNVWDFAATVFLYPDNTTVQINEKETNQ